LRYAQTLPVLIAAAVLLMSMTLAAGLVAEHISRRR
jgi:CHASE1-domain containing sensor protein